MSNPSTHYFNAAIMKLFYHFLVFVFVSLLLIACANIFTSDRNVKTMNNEPQGLKHEHNNKRDGSVKNQVKNDPYIITSFNYKNLLKGKRWTDNQCEDNGNFYLKNIQMVIREFSHYKRY